MQFTWANTLPNPTYEKLERVLASVEWEQKYPLVSVHAMHRAISYHIPLLVEGEATHLGNIFFLFRTKLWFEKENFLDIVAREWAKHVAG